MIGIGRRGFVGGLAAFGLATGIAPAAAKRQRSPAPLSVGDFSLVLDGLDHAEGIAAAPDGRLFLSSAAGALGVLEIDGRLRQIGTPIAPNGIAIDPQGRAIVANMGLLKQVGGPLQRIDVASGAVETLVAELEGRPLVASNGPIVARDGTIYCTHTSWGPVANIGTTTPAGFIYRVKPDGTADIIARSLRGANGLCLDREERFLYCSLTAEARIRRWRRLPDGTLADPEDYGPQLGAAHPDQMVRDILALPAAERAALGYCDGIGFDMAGNLWITLPFANRLVALTPDRRLASIVHDPEGRMIAMPTNLCWGGRDRRDLYVVSRGSGRIVRARTAIPGAPLANWPRG